MTSFVKSGLGIIAALGAGNVSTAASIINDMSTGKEDGNNAGQWDGGGGSGSGGVPMRPTNRRHSPTRWTSDNPQDIPMEGSYESMFMNTPPGYPVEAHHGRNIVPVEPTNTINPSVPEKPIKETQNQLITPEVLGAVPQIFGYFMFC